MADSIPPRWSRRLGRLALVAAALVLLEVVCEKVLWMPGPLLGAYIALDAGRRWAATNVPTPATVWRRHMAAGPPPDARVAAAGNGFGLRLLRTMAAEKPRSNVFISPYSLDAALCLTLNGLGGVTRSQLAGALGVEAIPPSAVNQAQARLATLLAYPPPRTEVRVANGLWCDNDGYRDFSPAFLKTARGMYRADAARLDLQSPSAPDTINRWATRRTDGKAAQVADHFERDTAFVLVNAVYFHGAWTHPFDKMNTRDRDFYRWGGCAGELMSRMADPTRPVAETAIDPSSVVRVPTMSRAAPYRYLRGAGFQAVRLPYGDGGMALYIFLPGNPEALPAFLNRLDAAMLDRSIAAMRERKVYVQLPRFSIRPDAEVIPALKTMGVRKLFERGKAEMAPMYARGPFRNMCVSKIRHRTYLDVNEEGTTAAAVTFEFGPKASGVTPYPYSVIVDHPFFCAIRDERSGQILFAGAIHDPTAAEG